MQKNWSQIFKILFKVDRWKAEGCPKEQPDTVLSRFLPNTLPGAISERMRETMHSSAKEIKADIKPKNFERLVFAKCQRSVAPPGEPVGLLAAQVRRKKEKVLNISIPSKIKPHDHATDENIQ